MPSTWNAPVFSVCSACASGSLWVWAAWNNIEDAYTFKKKPEKDLEADCLFYGEASSKQAAIKAARKLAGNNARQLNNVWSAPVCVVLGRQPYAEIVDGQAEINEELQKDLDQVHSLIGLGAVKSAVQELVNIAKISQMQAQVGIKAPFITRHLVFAGNPGTGKTTVARILGRVYKNLGVLSKGHFTEVDRTNLVAEYLGQTAPKTAQVVESALGGVLFIDEAYSLVGDKDVYGQEAINTLLKMMEDYRENLVVIVAGYRNEMAQFIESNPGLKSRFSRTIHFEDYSPSELTEIFKSRCEQHGYILSDRTLEALHHLILLFDRQTGELGNGRFIRNIFDRCVANQCNRLASLSRPSKDELRTFLSTDIPSYEQLMRSLS